MAKRVTSEDILRMNETYYQTRIFAEVARQTGFSASTVRKYVDTKWKPVVNENVVRFNLDDLPEFDSSIFKGINNYGDLCVLTVREKEKMTELWKEIAV